MSIESSVMLLPVLSRNFRPSFGVGASPPEAGEALKSSELVLDDMVELQQQSVSAQRATKCLQNSGRTCKL